MITTCSDPDNLFASRPEFSWLTEKTPKEHLEELIRVSNVINAWTKEQSLNRPKDKPLYLQHWYWLPLIGEEDAYGAKLNFGAHPRNEVMDYLRRQRPSVYQYPSALYIVCKVPPIPGAVEPAQRGVGTSTGREMGFPTLGYKELKQGDKEEKLLRSELDAMAERGYKIYGELRKDLTYKG